MNHSRGTTNKTSVQNLITLFTFVITLFSGFEGVAIATTPPSSPAYDNRDNCQRAVDEKDANKKAEFQKLCDRDSSGLSCSNKLATAQTARENISKACSEGSLGSDCISRAVVCAKVTRKEILDIKESDTGLTLANSVLAGLGMSSAVNIDTTKKRKNTDLEENSDCPQFSGADYESRKKDLKEELVTINKDLTEIDKELATAQKSADKELSDITKETQEAQKKANESKQDRDKDIMREIQTYSENKVQMRDNIRKQYVKLINLRAEPRRLRTKEQADLAAINDGQAKKACAVAANKIYEANFADFQRSRSLTKRKNIKREAIQYYRDCMEQMNDRRQSIIQEARTAKQTANTLVSQAEEELGDMTQRMTESDTDLAKIEKNKKLADDQAVQSLLKELQSAQTNMATIVTAQQKKIAEAAKRKADLQEKLNAKTNEQNNLGTPPDSDAKMSSATAGKTITTNMETIAGYIKLCCKENSICDPSMQDIAKKYESAGGESFTSTSPSSEPSRSSGRSGSESTSSAGGK